ncbi:Immunity protein Imm6 [Bacillus sp. 491mf]|uniref:Imm6 family immunity protein n=1 Tax=Bacillus sp. 491mf TaxID=1761755 RepID=UPI0008F3FB1F|nr:Imm6 family immunity protein [Bacillus sp. 491mf]SFC72518.1 Immunity protein Imm6 [Bacillus sp. 491mf]
MKLVEQYDTLLTNAESLLHAYEDIVKNKELYKEGQRVIGICKEWITNNEITADDIYETVDSQDGYDIVEFGYLKGITEEESYMWALLTNIVCVLCSIAYQMENQKYVPQAIECIIKEKIERFVIFINQNMDAHEDIKECLKYFNENLCY